MATHADKLEEWAKIEIELQKKEAKRHLTNDLVCNDKSFSEVMDKALSMCEKKINLAPTSSKYYHLKSFILHRAKQYQKSRIHLEKAIHLSPAPHIYYVSVKLAPYLSL